MRSEIITYNYMQLKNKSLSPIKCYRHKVRKKKAAIATAKKLVQHNDCRYNNVCKCNFIKINKLPLITTKLVITTIIVHVICQINASSVAPLSALSALLKSGEGGGLTAMESSQNNNSLRQQQQQLFALLIKNKQQLTDSYKTRGGESVASESFKRQISNDKDLYSPMGISNQMLETSGYVSDDGLQYEKADLADANSLQFTNKTNNQLYSNNCPNECTCLNDYFDCGKKYLENVPVLPDYVQVLDFVGNKLNDVTVLDIKNLIELHKLNLKRNQLENVPNFQGLVSLKQLNLANNRIQRISREALAALPKLKSLDLSKNYLHKLELNSFPQNNRLAHLILNYNKISDIDEDAFSYFEDLVDLEINNNNLSVLPAGVFQNLTRLKKLSLNYNNLEIRWLTFRGLQSLEKLLLKSNNITFLEDGVFHVMSSIETIELDHNLITSLSRQGLYNLTKLHHLSLSNNSISRIELDTWEFTQSLTSLDLSRNNISEFKPQHLECLQHLQRLNLGHNKIQYLMENTFDCVKNLEDLNLRRNKLAWVIEDQSSGPPFKMLRKLKRLDLYGNNLKQISAKSLVGLSNLESLNLGGNALASVQSNSFENMPRLQKLIFKSINFICDCDLLWFRRWLLKNFLDRQKIQKNAVCGYPEHLLDRELHTLTPAELICADTPKPIIIKEPTNQLAVNGANITMECFASSPAAASLAAADELKIIWRHDNQNLRSRYPGSNIIQGATHGIHSYINTETQVHHDQSKNQTKIIGYLRLYNVSSENAGKYQCVVSNAFGTTYSQKFRMSIGIHPRFLQTPSNLTIDSGDTARLVCSATGDPIPEMALQKFGGSDFPAATERRLQVIREENAFVITNAKPIDTGIYTCTAESATGEIKVNASLIVNDKPQPLMPHVRKESVLGDLTALECINDDAVDIIDPHREWYKDNKPFHASSTSASKRNYFTNEREYLIIRDTQSDDAGHYRCEITDNSKTFTILSELVVVKGDLNQSVIIVGVVLVTIVCVLVGSLVIWTILCFQKRKMILNEQRRGLDVTVAENVNQSAHANQQMLNGNRGSEFDETQLTILNRTYFRPSRYTSQRPRSLADLDYRNINESVRNQQNRLILNRSSNYQNNIGAGITLEYLQNTSTQDLEHQDQLSSKDSGTGSDAATKRSIDDFTITLLPKTSSLVRGMNEIDQIHNKHYADDDNDLEFASTRAFGISEYDIQLCDINHESANENELFLHNDIHNHIRDEPVITANGNCIIGVTEQTSTGICKDSLSTNFHTKNKQGVDI